MVVFMRALSDEVDRVRDRENRTEQDKRMYRTHLRCLLHGFIVECEHAWHMVDDDTIRTYYRTVRDIIRQVHTHFCYPATYKEDVAQIDYLYTWIARNGSKLDENDPTAFTK